MIYKLIVPGSLPDVEEVRILEWHGDVGRMFDLGDLIVELETYKAVVEVRAGRSGHLRKILCDAGDWQKVGEPLAVFSDDPVEELPDSLETLNAWSVEFEIT